MPESRYARNAESPSRSSPLPVDYLRMVEEVFTSHFTDALKAIPNSRFEASGSIFPDEIVVSVSLTSEGSLGATSVHVSADFDPKASAPTLQDVLGACVDAAGVVFGSIPQPALEAATLAGFDHLPLEWTSQEIENIKVHVRADKANLRLEQLTEDWLAKNDPDAQRSEAKAREQTEALFVTGDKAKKQPIH